MLLSVEKLCKSYEMVSVLQEVSFSIDKGNIVGFLGPNGAGKSTTMKIITGCLHADSGKVRIAGKGVAHHNEAVKKRIGYLPENNPLYLDMYVMEYLSFIGSLHRLKDSAQRVQKVIIDVGLEREKRKKIGQLSKGYRQRVGLAAAIIHQPDVLILDEPTAGLDPNQIQDIRALIVRLGKDRVVLLSTHILQEAEYLCNRILILHKGKIKVDIQRGLLNDTLQEIRPILVRFVQPITRQDLAPLDELLHTAMEEEGVWTLYTRAQEALRKALMQLAVTQDWTILSLQESTENLATLFQKHTQD